MNPETIRTFVGVLGNMISCGLFLAPIPTMIKVCNQKDVQGFKPHPYLATVLNCLMWLLYGLPIVHPDCLLIITINTMGLVIEGTYVAIFFVYSNWNKRKWIATVLAVEIVFMIIVVLITLYCFHTTTGRSMIVGILCIIFNVLMYTSPLTVIKMVIKTKSVKYMPLPLSVANFVNGIVWVAYALLKFDPYILIPNALGTVSGLVQLGLYATYYKSTNWDDDDDDDEKGKAPETQLASA